MFTVFLFSKNPTEEIEEDYKKLTKNLKNINTKIIEFNTENIDQIIILPNKEDIKYFYQHKLKLLNITKQELETYPNLTNYLQRNFFGNS